MEPKWKFTDPPGFAALIESIKNARKTSGAAASGVSGLQGDIQGLANQLTAGFKQANTALQTLDDEKLNKTNGVSVTLPATGWKEGQGSAVYPYYLDIDAEAVTALDRVTVIVSLSSLPDATSCGLCPTCETASGKIRLWSASKPTADITAEYWVEQGASPSQEEGKE